MNTVKFTTIILLTLLLVGCGETFDTKLNKYFPLNPQNSGQSVIISSNPPLNTEPRVWAKYVSKKCATTHFSSDFIPTGKDKREKKIKWNIQSKGDNQFETAIPINGGGWCKWKLSNIMIGLIYDGKRLNNKNIIIDTEKLLNISINTKEEKFSKDSKQDNLSNSLKYTSKFYPVYKEIHNEYTRVFFISPYGEGKHKIWLSQNMDGYIHYNPKLDNSKATNIFVSKGNSWVKYPDGEIEYGTDSANYYKIERSIIPK